MQTLQSSLVSYQVLLNRFTLDIAYHAACALTPVTLTWHPRQMMDGDEYFDMPSMPCSKISCVLHINRYYTFFFGSTYGACRERERRSERLSSFQHHYEHQTRTNGGWRRVGNFSFFLFLIPLTIVVQRPKHCHYRCTTLLNRMIGPSNPRCMYVILFFFYQYTYEVL